MSLPEDLLGTLSPIRPPAGGCYRVAFSGGSDSTVLLHALASVRTRLSAPLRAIHVDHGLSPHAGDWSTWCADLCRSLEIPLDSCTVAAAPTPGESPEAAARAARYRGLARFMRPGDVLVTAHHRDDQAETLLLQLFRGAGVRGTAAMGRCTPFARGVLARPLLEVPRTELAHYAREHDLSWIDDPSNFDTSFDRNFLRHRVMPLLSRRWPALSRTLARSARHQAEAAGLLEELAESDLCHCRGGRAGTLSVGALLALSPARARNLLRHWLKGRGLSLPRSSHLQRVLDEVLRAGEDREPVVHWPGGEVRRYRDDLHALTALPAVPAGDLPWHGCDALGLGELGRLSLSASIGQGLRCEAVEQGAMMVTFRRGGERCRLAGRSGSRSVKKMLQEAGVPPWERRRLPLVYIDGKLAAIADLWVCDPFAAKAGESGFTVHWARKAIET